CRRPQRRMRCAIPSRRTCWRAAAMCARSRNCSAMPRYRRRRSTLPLIPSDCWKSTAAPIRGHDEGVTGATVASPCEAGQFDTSSGRRRTEGDMSHGVHAVQHEVEHQIEHEEHGHGGGRGKPVAGSRNKKIALLISVIALFLALAEMFGKSAQTEAISLNIKASDAWNFFQAKTIRQTTLRTAAQALALEAATVSDEAKKAALLKQAD